MGKYHDILGVSSTASEEEIRRAYKQKVKENHPDLHPDDPEATERIKEINEAYSGLKNGLNGPQSEMGSRGPHGTRGFGSHDVFEEMMRNARDQFRNAHTTMQQHVQVPLDILREGGTYAVEIGVPIQHGNGFRLVGVKQEIEIAPDTPIGQKIEIEVSHGDWSSAATLIILPMVPPDYEFSLPNHLSVAVEVDAFVMMLGGKHSIKLPWNKTISVKIPEGTTAGQQIRLSGLGVKHVHYGTGDLYVHVIPKIPILDKDQRDILSKAVEQISERS